MIISAERQIVIYGTPRTGSSTLRTILEPYNLTYNHDDHGGYHDLVRFVNQTGEFHGIVDPTKCKHFAFYRDPYERCLSTVNYIRRGRQCFRFFHAMYGNIIPVSCADRTPYAQQPEHIRAMIDAPPFIEVFRAFKWNMEVGVFGKTQRRWVDVPVIPLNYHDYDNEVRRLFDELGLPQLDTIPKTNDSLTIPEIDVITPEDEAEIREYLQEDYEFLASRGITFG